MRIKINKNQKGFTLVELVAAVAILSIAIAPIFHAFSTSTDVSIKSRRIGEVTAMTQNIQEAVKAFSVEDFCAYGSDVQSILGGSATSESSDEGKTVTIRNMGMGGNQYDAVVNYVKPVSGDGLYDFNNKEICKYNSMTGTFAQSGLDNQNPDTIADEKYAAVHSGADATKDRTINIRITKGTDDEGQERVYVVVEYVYSYKMAGGATYAPDSSVYTVFPSGYVLDNDSVPSVYIMYYPNYTFTFPKRTQLDKINIYNTDDVHIKIFLVKQAEVLRDSTTGKVISGKTYLDDSGKKVTLSAKEQTYHIQIKHYLPKNYNSSSLSEYNSLFTNAFRDITKDVGAVNSKISDTKYSIVTGNAWSTESDGQISGDVVPSEKNTRIWYVEIKIYKKGAKLESDEPFYTYSGTKMV